MLNRSIVILWLVLCFCFHAGPVARADAASQAERQIQAIYDKQDAGMNRKDLEEAIFHIDLSYIWHDADGLTKSYQAWVKALSNALTQMMHPDFGTVIEKIRMVGPQTAFVVATHHVDFGVMVAPGVPGSAASTYTDHDKWIKRAKGWMLIQSFVIGKAHKK